MSITRLPEIVFPITQINKVNEIVDVLNDNLNMYYSEENPVLVPTSGIATWTVTHNLGTENVNCSLYNGDMLVLSSVSITSDNVVTVSLNSDATIAEGTYKIVIISNGAGSSSGSGSYVLPTASTTTLGGVRIDGSSITINNGVISSIVDSALSSTSTNPVQNKILYPALSEFIPANTQIDVELDGSGDFTTIADAISYLTDKWSNGAVTIQLGSGTFSVTSAIVLSNKTIPLIYLKGKGQNSTIISTSASVGIQVNTGVTSTISALKIVKSTDTKTGTGIQVDAGTLRFENMTFDNFNLGIANLHGAVHLLSGNIFMNCNTGVHVERIGTVVSNLGSTISFSTVGTAWKVATGGMIATSTPTSNITYTNVTNKCSQTVGQFNANGYIGGTLQN